MDARIVLLPSVLLGSPSVLRLAESLEALGRSATPAAAADSATTPAEVAARYRAEASTEEPIVWVAHSNAGLYLPRLLADRPQDLGIFVDASVPGGRPPHVSASGARLRALSELADGSGRLPAWVDWWTAEQLEEVLPDEGHRRLLRDGGTRLPLDYFTAEIDVPADWSGVPRGYISFDGVYVEERLRMAAEGWPTAHLPGGHLTMLTRPRDVATAIIEMESALRELVTSGRRHASPPDRGERAV